MRFALDHAAPCPTPAPEPPAVIDVAGAGLEPTPEGGLWWPSQRLRIVADLHLEKGSAFARRGSLVPPYDTGATLAALARLVARLDPACILSLGDAFHDPGGPCRLAPVDRDRIAALQAGRDWIWIAGNHDPVLDGEIGGACADELAVGPLVFRHLPTDGPAQGEVAGHLHPTARVALRARTVRRRCFASDGSRMLVPAFGVYAGGLDLFDRACRRLFDQARLSAHLLGDGRVYSFPGRMLVGG